MIAYFLWWYLITIWYNTNICNYSNKEWFEKGITFVKDFCRNEYVMSLEHLLQVKDNKCNFIKYESIKRNIQVMHVQYQINEKIRPILPIMLDKITFKGKGCNRIYRSIQKTSKNFINGTRLKWENILNDDVGLNYIISALNITQQLPKCVLNRYDQFKNLNDRFNTKNCFLKWKLSKQTNAYIAKNIMDSIVHALIECPCTADLWRQI